MLVPVLGTYTYIAQARTPGWKCTKRPNFAISSKPFSSIFIRNSDHASTKPISYPASGDLQKSNFFIQADLRDLWYIKKHFYPDMSWRILAYFQGSYNLNTEWLRRGNSYHLGNSQKSSTENTCSPVLVSGISSHLETWNRLKGHSLCDTNGNTTSSLNHPLVLVQWISKRTIMMSMPI